MKQRPRKARSSIRRLAERRLAAGTAVDIDDLTAEEIRNFVHELEVHRIELAIQNEQLAEAQATAETAMERYRDLYESAPIGYLTLDLEGVIVTVNLVASELLGAPRAQLIGQKISSFVAKEHQDDWHFARRTLSESTTRRSIEIELALPDGSTRQTQLVSSGHLDAQGKLSLAVLDVTELRSAEHALRKAASEVSLTEQRERRKLAADLHDDAGQLLSLASLKLRALADVVADGRYGPFEELAELITEARRRITSLSFQLSPPLLHDVGLVAAARWLAEDLERCYGLSVHVAEGEELALDEAESVTLFRALRELLINVTKHAAVDRARVEIWRDGPMARVAIEDAGVGFGRTAGGEGGFGLLALRERLGQLGGTLAIGPGPRGVGSRVVASVPLKTQEGGSS